MSYSVGQVADLAGVTIRTLHHYDEIGLLSPGGRSAAGYRIYEEPDLERLQRILFYRELGFALEEIATIVDDPSTDAVPAVNQIEVHPYFTNEAVREYGQEHGIAIEAWSPIAQGGVLEDSTITRIADKVGKTPAQVVLRWHIQRGDIIFPKSVTPSRMKENFELFDFELEQSDMDEISALDRGEDGRTGPNPDTFAYIPS